MWKFCVNISGWYDLFPRIYESRYLFILQNEIWTSNWWDVSNEHTFCEETGAVLLSACRSSERETHTHTAAVKVHKASLWVCTAGTELSIKQRKEQKLNHLHLHTPSSLAPVLHHTLKRWTTTAVCSWMTAVLGHMTCQAFLNILLCISGLHGFTIQSMITSITLRPSQM